MLSDRTTRPRQAQRCRQGPVDPGPDRAGGGGAGDNRDAGAPYRGAGDAARRTDPPTKDPGHLVQAAVAGPEARPSCARHGSATRKSRPGVGRTLHPNPARVLEARLSACPKCQAMFPHAAQTPQQVYERIELPPIRPDVTQVRLSGGRCACCGERVTAEALPDWSRVRRSAAPSPRWWSICMTLMPSAWNGWPR